MILLVALFLLFCLPNLGFTDCASLGRMDRWYVQDDGNIMFYGGNVLLATVELQDCTVDSSSNIRLLQPYVCDGEEIFVDGERCTLLNVTVE